MLGVTGTNGKTTTAFLQHAILTAAGHETGLLGTIERRIGRVAEPAVRTTAEAVDLHRDLRRMADAGDTACAMEVSSHALDQERVTIDLDLASTVDAERLAWLYRHATVHSHATMGDRATIEADVPRRLLPMVGLASPTTRKVRAGA